MKLYKKAERKLDATDMIKTMRMNGFEVRHIGEWDKWKDLVNDLGDFGKLQVTMNVYEAKNDTLKCYMMADTLGRVCAPLTEDKQEVMNWLEEHGYKRDKQWYMEENGMDEDTWNYWNGLETR